MPPDDTELLRRYVREGCDTAFRELVQRHLGVVFHAALRQVGGDSHRAEEVAQEVFTLFARKASALTEHPVLIGWLFSTTRRVAARAMRTELRRRRREQLSWEIAVSATEDAVADWTRLKPVLDAALEELAGRERDALLLRFFQEQPFAEIGRRTNVTEDAARMRVERALDKLRARLARHGVTSTTAALSLVLTHNAVASAPAGLAANVAAAALSGAVVGGGTIALAAKVLLMTKAQLIAAGSALVLLAGAVAWQSRENAVLERQLESERQRGATVQDSISRLEQARVGIPSSIASQSPAPVLSPETQKRKLKHMLWSRKAYDRKYAALYRHLRLPPVELEQFKDLLAEREWDQLQAFAYARENGLKEMTNRESRQLNEAASVAANEQISAFLGETSYAYFKRYDRTATLRNVFARFTDETKVLGDPLSDDQMDQFTELARVHGMVESLDTWREGRGPMISDTLLAEATAFLSPLQVERLRAAQEELAANRRIAAINREAALQGKLKLKKSSARYYPSSPVTKDSE